MFVPAASRMVNLLPFDRLLDEDYVNIAHSDDAIQMEEISSDHFSFRELEKQLEETDVDALLDDEIATIQPARAHSGGWSRLDDDNDVYHAAFTSEVDPLIEDDTTLQ